MNKYRFQIQSCIDIEVDAENRTAARQDVVDNITRYAAEMVQDPYVSEGVEILN